MISMTLESVIEAGKHVVRPDLPWYSEFTWGISLTVLFLFVIGVLLIIWSIADDGMGGRISFGIILIIIGLIGFGGTILMSNFKEGDIYDARVKAWKSDYARPFIESLPKEKREIVYIKVDPELAEKTAGEYLWGNGYTHSTEVKKIAFTVMYKDGTHFQQKTNWYDASGELTKEEKPYIEFQRLPKNLGHGIKAGDYNSKVHLPDNYQFTDIK
jgi:hypothetical protein